MQRLESSVVISHMVLPFPHPAKKVKRGLASNPQNREPQLSLQAYRPKDQTLGFQGWLISFTQKGSWCRCPMALRQGGRLPVSEQHRRFLLGTRTQAVRELKVYLGP